MADLSSSGFFRTLLAEVWRLSHTWATKSMTALYRIIRRMGLWGIRRVCLWPRRLYLIPLVPIMLLCPPSWVIPLGIAVIVLVAGYLLIAWWPQAERGRRGGRKKEEKRGGRGAASPRPASVTRAVKFQHRSRLLIRKWSNTMEHSKLTRSPSKKGKFLREPSDTPRMPKLIPGSIRLEPYGLTVTADGSSLGIGAEAFQSAIVPLRNLLKAHDVFIHRHRRKGLTVLKIIFEDPFARTIYLDSLPGPSRPDLVVVGRDAEGQPVEINLWLPILVLGAKGSGKTSLFWLILAALLELKRPFLAMVFDSKEGSEFPELNGSAYLYMRRDKSAREFMRLVMQALSERRAAMRAAGVKKCAFDDPRFPVVVILIDEQLNFWRLLKTAKPFKHNGVDMSPEDALEVLMSECRSANFVVIAGAQKGQKADFGTVRDQFESTICLRVSSEEMAKIGTGDPKLYPAHQIWDDPSTAGTGYVHTEKGVTMFRSAYVEENEQTEIAAGIRALTDQYGGPIGNEPEDEALPPGGDSGSGDAGSSGSSGPDIPVKKYSGRVSTGVRPRRTTRSRPDTKPARTELAVVSAAAEDES